MEVKVVERSLQIQVQEQEIVRRDRELEATVKKPAEAEVFRLTKIAEANKNKVWCSSWFLLPHTYSIWMYMVLTFGLCMSLA